MATDRERAEELPCPFCGDQPIRRIFGNPKVGVQEWSIIECHCLGRPQVMEPSNLEAVRAWNTRALAPTDAEREAMREVVRQARIGRAFVPHKYDPETLHEHLSTCPACGIDAALARLDAATGGRGDNEGLAVQEDD